MNLTLEQREDGDTLIAGSLTLRDYFAAKAMQGFVANKNRPTTLAKDDATWCYEIADAMIQARTAL